MPDPTTRHHPVPLPTPGAAARVMRRARQTRDFRPDPVPEEILRGILDVARWTGSAGNRQPWTFIVVTDPEVRRKMAEACPYTAHIGNAPVVIVVALEPRGEETDNFEEGRLAERMLVAASAYGIGAGLARARAEAKETIAGLLGVPPDRLVRTMVSVGYPTEAGAAPKSPAGRARKPFDEVVRWERFG